MKKLQYIFITLVCFMLFTIKVDAANITLTKNHSSITKGGYVTVTAQVNSESPIVSIEGTLNCTGAGNATVSMVFDDMSNSLYSKTFSATVKGGSVGNITCSVNGVRITNMSSSDWQYLGNQSTTIKVTAPRTYSGNNNLSSLTVEGYEISTTFNKNVLEYNIDVPNEVRQININATKEDGTANITGAGIRDLIEGLNRIEIVVTAENGAQKVYVINVLVKDLDPIIVKLDDKEYNVVRKKEELTIPSTFKETTVKINEFDVPALINENIGYTLVGLKDSLGEINLYIYDIKNNSYKIYKEYTFKSSIIYVLNDETKIPIGYKKANLKLGEDNIIAYKNTTESKYYLFYGINVETGKENLYVYDSLEETVQRFNNEKNTSKEDNAEELYLCIIVGLGSLLILTYIVLLISLIKNSKKKKEYKRKKSSENKKVKSKEKDIDEELDE